MNEQDDPESLTVEVAYATPEKQRLISLTVQAGTTAAEAAALSGIADEFPQIDLEQDPMGIFSRRLDGKILPLPAEYELRQGDRVEIYRPLLLDPKQARLLRAERKQARKERNRKQQDQ